jgi:CubicO group peptidase (beta-lactamase class C family)
LHETARFNVGSVTKTFIAALVLALVEDGLLGLGDNATATFRGDSSAGGGAGAAR